MFENEVQHLAETYQKTQDTIKWGKSLGLDKINCRQVDIHRDNIVLRIAPGELTQLRKQLGKGWKRYHQFNNNEGSIFMNYIHQDHKNARQHLTILIDAKMSNGKSCRKVPIGTKIETVYKVVCE